MAVTRRTEPWSALLDAGRADERLVREAFEGAREPRARRRLPADLHPAVRAGAAHARASTRSTPTRPRRSRRPGQAPTIVTTGTASGKSLCFNLPTLDVLCTRRQGARALPLPDQGARPGPGARAATRFGLAQAGAPGDLRRRHAARGAPGDPPARRTSSSRTPTCSTSGSCPTTRAWARLLRQPRRRRRRRGARLPRRLRLARRQRPAPAAAGRRRLRDRAALPAGQRDDRQPGRAGRAPDRPRGRRARRPRRLAGRAAPDRDVEPAGGRRGAADARAARWPRRPRCVAELVREGARTICFIKSRKAVELVARLVATS